jgi:hypothetical protein
VSAWTQKGFAVISDVVAGEVLGPFLHFFGPARYDADREIKSAGELPERCRINIRIVEAELHFDDEQRKESAA